ncbi:FAD-linked oxidase C-terminal domain-containing protein [Rugosimonospora acidiphila]|uniref:FAD-linked oxidase C-terminal domain-containing protein n=1 Tax=Rugosimonospora acidiphila TaxID=556531 RepID=A0ABP9RGJ4_9ACTN
MTLAMVAQRLRRDLGDAAVITDLATRRTYECDGLTPYRCTPGLVVLPEEASGVRAAMLACRDAGMPFSARGCDTGLSGRALPEADGVLIVTSRMRRIIEIDLRNLRAVVEPGVVNLAITREVAPGGYFYAGDPSSRRICSIGGDVAENSGGAHCVKYGFTVHHVTGLEVCTPGGELVQIGAGTAARSPGYDLTGVFVGAEGTLGIATKIAVRLLRAPEAACTILAAFDRVERAGAAVSAIIAAGIQPAAAEIMDALAIEAAEAAVHCGYPAGARALLIIELDGPAVEVEAETAAVTELCAEAFEIRTADDPARRAAIWKGRKSAFAAVGRISRDYLAQDAVIPRAALAEVLGEIDALAGAAGLRVANLFHACEGNLHPLVLYDGQLPGARERAEWVSGQILDLCVARGGSISGEHGVEVDRSATLFRMFSADDLDTMRLVRSAFDPDGLASPGKVFPAPGLCAERSPVALAPRPNAGPGRAGRDNRPGGAWGRNGAGGRHGIGEQRRIDHHGGIGDQPAIEDQGGIGDQPGFGDQPGNGESDGTPE